LTGPLEGVRILDMSSVVSGPLAAMLLADQGASVTRVEPTGRGDLLRAHAFRRGGLTSFFANNNRGKRSIAIDATKKRGRALVLELAREADVFLENYRPGVVQRLGLAEPDLRAVNERIIYCSISGYGPTGPYAGRRVYDPIIQGLTGHVAIQKNPDVPIPDLVRNIVADKASSYTAAQAITAALFARERGAGGQHIEIPMLDASLAFFWPDGMMAHTLVGEGVVTGPTLYDVYRLTETSDGHLVYFAANDQEWYAVFRAIGREELCADERFARAKARTENAETLGALLYAEFRKWKTEEILERMVAEDVPVGPVRALDEIFDDPQIVHNEAIFEREHPTAGTVRQCRPAARFSATPQAPGRLPPLLGEHTDEILAEIGHDATAREALRAEGVIE
jgi:crotonobetainyl-CoA:carnitine CoA-transferase CaiB-like acyl-CoA transferase